MHKTEQEGMMNKVTDLRGGMSKKMFVRKGHHNENYAFSFVLVCEVIGNVGCLWLSNKS